MSRCFPFPPPGYENKARPDNDVELNSVVKKDKDKKHKDKKDKDKKEQRERKDKERAKGKHKEDKDRKRKKHRDKKDKRDKQKSLEEKNVSGPSENQNGEKPGPDDKPGDGANSFRLLAEMGKQVKSDDGQTDKKKAKHVSSEEKEIVRPYVKKPVPDNNKPGNRDNGSKISVEMEKVVQINDVVIDKEKWIVRPSENQNSEKPGPGKKPGNGANGFRISVETGKKKFRNDDGATDKMTEKKNVGPPDNQNCEKPGPDEKKSDRILVEMGKRVRNNDGATDSSYHASMANGHSLGVNAKCSGNYSGEKRIKVENGSCSGNMVGQKMEGREKNKNRDKSKKEDKKRKMEEKKDKVNEKSKEKVKQRAIDVNLLEFCANKPEDFLKESWDKQGKLPKLKEPVLNGVLHENGSWLNNMSRPAISTYHVGQNGNESHPSQKNTIIPLAVENQVINTNSRINGTKLASPQPVLKHVQETEPGLNANTFTPEHVRARIDNHAFSNGFIPSHSLVENGIKTTGTDNNTSKTVNGLQPILEGKKNISSRTQSASVKPKEIVGTFIKAPHPDLKYLSQILTVPELESPLFDDNQEWLFGCKDAKRPKFGSAVVDTDRVWAEAIQLESVDVIALPYVIPY